MASMNYVVSKNPSELYHVLLIETFAPFNCIISKYKEAEHMHSGQLQMPGESILHVKSS